MKSQPFLDEEQSLTCVHCGLCLASCPTYLETGNENDSPRGRLYLMRAVNESRTALGETTVRHIDLCLGCRACEAVCPSGVPYGELLEHTRDHIEKNYERSTFQTFLRRVAIEKIFPFPTRMRVALLPVRLIRALGMENLMPRFVRDSMALIPEKMKSVRLPEFSPSQGTRPTTEETVGRVPSRGEAAKRVGFVSGCVQSVLFGETNANSVHLLNGVGYDVITPQEQGCCGALYAHSGNLEQARACARHNIEVFERTGVDTIIINAAGCGSTLKEYDKLFAGDARWIERAKKFSEKVRDLVEVLPKSQPPTPNSQLVTYHDACHLCHAQRISKPPRELVKGVAGTNFVELPESEICCGSAGSYNLTEPEMAERLQQRKVQNILKTGAEVVVTTNPGCILQIRAGLRKAGEDKIRVLHVADYLAEKM